MMEALGILAGSTLVGYGVVLAAAGLAMWALSKLPARIRRANGNGAKRLISSQSRGARR